MRMHPMWLMGAGINLVTVGICSFIFHSSQTKLGYILDHFGINITLTYQFFYEAFNLF